jgi:gamma-glutamyltranspeptidase
MVVASQSDATRAGVEMLEAGGNAVDAAVATAFAVGVSQPFSTGLGGGAFILLRLADGSVFAIDARETAPAAADAEMYVRPAFGAPRCWVRSRWPPGWWRASPWCRSAGAHSRSRA